MIDRSVIILREIRSKSYPLLIGGAVCSALLLKVWLILFERVPFNADEAIVALMARHILEGENPLFFYGQAYIGSLDAYLTAIGFFLFGTKVWVLRALQTFLYLGVIVTSCVILWVITRSKTALVIGGWLLAIPAVNLTLYTTVSLGGYGETLLIGNLLVLVTLRIARHWETAGRYLVRWLWFVLGFLIGLGLWTFGLSLVYAIPCLLYLMWIKYRARTNLQSAPFKIDVPKISPDLLRGLNSVIFIMGGLSLGAVPWLYHANQFGINALFGELAGSAIAGVEGLNLADLLFRRVLNFGVLGGTVITGLRPPWEVRWLALPLMPFVLMFWIAVTLYAVRVTIVELRNGRNNPNDSHAPLFAGILLILGIGFCLTPFGADPSGRYFLPVIIVLSLFAAQAIYVWANKYTRWVFLIIPVVIIFNLWGTIQSVLKFPPGLTTQFDTVTQIDHRHDKDLIDFLRSVGETRGFTNYWVAYPLAFLSGEDLIYIPRLPYHEDFRYTPRDDRYSNYHQILDTADQVAYITTNNPRLNVYLREQLTSGDISWTEKKIGDYQIFYDLSRRIDPQEMGLGTP